MWKIAKDFRVAVEDAVHRRDAIAKFAARSRECRFSLTIELSELQLHLFKRRRAYQLIADETPHRPVRRVSIPLS